MAENYYGSLSMPKHLIDAEIENQIRVDFNLDPIDYSLSCSLYSSCETFEENGVITFTDAMAQNGCFETLESLLIEKKVPYDRYSSSFYESPPSRSYFRPDATVPEIDLTLDHNEDTYINTCDLEPLLSLSADQIVPALKELLEVHDPKVRPLSAYVPQ
ncbi:hypothetical protein A8L34_28100 [Bacillus sp. FJAT-27264]|uniref:hypothetical protein n=1 Tax=Paenibacillus sp. (strain DSM 101736 / FJAT-27264) TaxID=1850362 RepID=UPI000807AE8A|nr:hypothetical protein [Bacillus sp. FJAT-27264]OBZ15912.1 hypothetical protein A8L34_28100 [Bacillus sp. FJAT-27264]